MRFSTIQTSGVRMKEGILGPRVVRKRDDSMGSLPTDLRRVLSAWWGRSAIVRTCAPVRVRTAVGGGQTSEELKTMNGYDKGAE